MPLRIARQELPLELPASIAKAGPTALATAFGTGTCNVPYSPITSCHFYDMDNEPEIWNGTHRDVHPAPPGYDELANLFEKQATL